MEQDNNSIKADSSSNPSEREISESTKEFLTRHWEYYLDFTKTALQEGDDAPHYLLRRLEEMKSTLTYLQFPWEKAIPIIHQGTCLCYEVRMGPNERRRLMIQSTQFLEMAIFMAQNKKTIHRLLLYLENQIKDLKALIGEPENQSEQ